MTALAFRASLEVTDHSRSAELSHGLPKWLEHFGMATDLMQYERELLDAPYGTLDSSQSREAHWSGEAAWVLAWAIGLVERPPECEPTDYRILFERLRIMRPEVRQLLAAAEVRPTAEWVEYCVATWALRSELQLRNLEPGNRDLLADLQRKRLLALGLSPDPDVIDAAVRLVDSFTGEECTRGSGLAFVREHALFWLLSDRSSYFEN